MVNVKLFNDIRKTLNEKGVKLIAVSKTKPLEDIDSLYNEGQRVFGENRVGMASFTENIELVRSEFKNLKNIFDTLKTQFFQSEASFCEISMGMSGDYAIAVEEGSTIVRIGSLLFGER